MRIGKMTGLALMAASFCSAQMLPRGVRCRIPVADAHHRRAGAGDYFFRARHRPQLDGAGVRFRNTAADNARWYSATLKQVNPDRAVPVLAVQPISICSGPPRTGCGRYTGVTVQLPFEMLADNPDTPLGTLIGGARLVFSENGVAIPEVELDTLVDQIHILRMCDLLYAKPGYDCSPVATHSDGSIIGVDHPAKAGEEIVLYAFGLGNTMPTVPTGAAPTAPAPVFLPFRASFDPRSNAAPSKPPASSPAPLFDGVTPGFVGLYQINVQVPRLPPGSPACSPSSART